VAAQNQIDTTTLGLTEKKVAVSKYLPESGDFSIGIDITPVINLIGNSFNGFGTDGTKNTLEGLGGSVINLNYAPKPDVSVMGKYFLKDNMALRANIGILTHYLTQRAYVTSDVLTVTDPFSDIKLIDCGKSFNSGGSATFGLEHRVGQNRIQGIFGGDLLFAYQTRHDVFQYGNTLTLLNSNPTMSTIMPAFDAAGYRTTERFYGDIFYAGAMLNAGVEYFISPKVAIGTEVNMMFYYRLGSSTFEKREGLNPYTNALETRDIITSPGDREFVMGTGNFGSKLYFAFYF
jgi:hypothetical protein